jgi:uracil-DNA glycosylase
MTAPPFKRDQRPVFDARSMHAKCGECPLAHQRPVAPAGPIDAAVVVVGEAPGHWEQVQGKPFVGPSGVKLDELLYRAGLRRQDVRTTNALLCRPEVPGETGKKRYDVKGYMAWLRRENKRLRKLKQEPIGDPFACCWPRLRFELWQADRFAFRRGAPSGVVVVPMGNFALKQLAGVQGVLKYRGSVLQPKKEEDSE